MTDTYILLKIDGSRHLVDIENENFNDEVHRLINCIYYELVHLPGDIYLVVDELGKVCEKPKDVNVLASMLYPGTPHGDPIVGDVLIGKLGYVNGESDMVGLSDFELKILEEYFAAIYPICFKPGTPG